MIFNNQSSFKQPIPNRSLSPSEHQYLFEKIQNSFPAVAPPLLRLKLKHMTILHASMYTNLKLMKSILAHPKTNPNTQVHSSNTPLHAAALSGNNEALRLLLKHPDINPNQRNTNNETPLHLAENAETICLLRIHGADLSLKNNNNQSPIDVLFSTNPKRRSFAIQALTLPKKELPSLLMLIKSH